MAGKVPREPKDWSSISKDDASGGLSSASRPADKKQDEEKRDIQDGDTLQTH
jgi:hypothetical protein